MVAARLEPGDVGENEAADAVARALAGDNVSLRRAFTGRANFYADAAGLCVVDRDAVERFNLVDETITLATLPPDALVRPKEMVATVKIIPLCGTARRGRGLRPAGRGAGRRGRAVPRAPRGADPDPACRHEGDRSSTRPSTRRATGSPSSAANSSSSGAASIARTRSPPNCRWRWPQGAEMVLVAGASAILDRRDVIPAAIVAQGGVIDHFGMPVDPGNLLLMGRIGAVAVLGLPGCARSPRVNGFDWVLRRLLADLPVDAAVLARMGVGGLLGEIPTRPHPRAKVTEEDEAEGADVPRAPRIAALVLAAGRSSRMGTVNKLLIGIDGKPMVRHAVEAVRDAGLAPIIVVTGHERERVAAALSGMTVTHRSQPGLCRGAIRLAQGGAGGSSGRHRRRPGGPGRYAAGQERRHRAADRRLQPGRRARDRGPHAATASAATRCCGPSASSRRCVKLRAMSAHGT